MSLLPFSDALRCLLLSVFQHFQDWRANVYTHAQKLLLVVNKPSSICVILLISATEIWQRVLGTGYWVLVPFDAVWASYLIYPSEKRKTCSHAACLNFPLVSRFAFVVSVNCRILKTHKIALCLPCQYSSYPLHRPSPAFFFFLFFGLSSGVNLCKAP